MATSPSPGWGYRLVRGLLTLVGLLFAALGLAWMVSPASLMANVDLVPGGAQGWNGMIGRSIGLAADGISPGAIQALMIAAVVLILCLVALPMHSHLPHPGDHN